MSPQKIDRGRCQNFFDTLSTGLVGTRAEIEVASIALGDQIETEWLPLLGISYDPKDDIVSVALEGLEHLIQRPQEVYADTGVGALLTIAIKDSEGVLHLVMLREPLMLPAPSSAKG